MDDFPQESNQSGFSRFAWLVIGAVVTGVGTLVIYAVSIQLDLNQQKLVLDINGTPGEQFDKWLGVEKPPEARDPRIEKYINETLIRINEESDKSIASPP